MRNEIRVYNVYCAKKFFFFKSHFNRKFVWKRHCVEFFRQDVRSHLSLHFVRFFWGGPQKFYFKSEILVGNFLKAADAVRKRNTLNQIELILAVSHNTRIIEYICL